MLTPLSTSQWTYAAAAHLLNRAGFGGTPTEIEAVRNSGLEASVERLLSPPNESDETDSPPWMSPHNLASKRRELRRLKEKPQERHKLARAMRRERKDEMLDLRFWWLDRMHAGRAPLLEKMTLFWHGHFATSVQKVRDAHWMWQQNETLRHHALGNFRTLLGAISRDPAMMIYLDLARSRKMHPNENWARELMELFTLGIGNYSEEDIRQSARAFTGYRLNLSTQEFRFERPLQDPGQKTFLRRSGKFTGDDILDLIVQQPACSHFLARKLWRYFVEDDPPPAPVDAVAASLRQNRFELRPILREILRSAAFFSPRVVRAQIKSPVQYLVQTCRLLEMDLPPDTVAQNALQQMGQLLFAPPNVKGWDGGKSWISTSTLLFRYNFTSYLLNGTGGFPDLPETLRRGPADLGKIIPAELREKPEELIAHLARRFWQTQPNDKQKQTFLAFLQTRAPDRSDETMRRLLHLMLSTPQFQLA